jgi:hypothetical protein
MLRAHVRLLLDAEDDAAICGALRAAPSAAVYRSLWSAICAVVEGRDIRGSDTGIVARTFAIPVIVVAGARRALEIPAALPDIAEILSLIERQGALGATRNFGLGAELVPLETLERLRPSLVYRWNTAFTGGAIEGMAGAPIEVAPGREQAHLRFLAGAGIAPAHLPSFVETAGDIGRWGKSFTQTVSRQLAQSGLELLPLARPPAALLEAAHTGRRAVLETAFQIFASQAIRACRMSAGEPTVIVSAHREGEAAEVRVSVSSLLDDALLEGFRRPLHPLDDLDEIAASIADLLNACRVMDVRWLSQVVAEPLPASVSAFIPVRVFERMAKAPMSH